MLLDLESKAQFQPQSRQRLHFCAVELLILAVSAPSEPTSTVTPWDAPRGTSPLVALVDHAERQVCTLHYEVDDSDGHGLREELKLYLMVRRLARDLAGSLSVLRVRGDGAFNHRENSLRYRIERLERSITGLAADSREEIREGEQLLAVTDRTGFLVTDRTGALPAEPRTATQKPDGRPAEVNAPHGPPGANRDEVSQRQSPEASVARVMARPPLPNVVHEQARRAPQPPQGEPNRLDLTVAPGATARSQRPAPAQALPRTIRSVRSDEVSRRQSPEASAARVMARPPLPNVVHEQAPRAPQQPQGEPNKLNPTESPGAQRPALGPLPRTIRSVKSMFQLAKRRDAP